MLLPLVIAMGIGAAHVGVASAITSPAAPVALPATPGSETEPNETPATATALTPGERVRATVFPAGDVDYYEFTAAAGDRVYAATMTAGSAGNSTDSQLTLYASDGTTVIEFDDNNGTHAATSSSIAGAVIPTGGTYYLRVNDSTASTGSEKPYDLYLDVESGAPVAETEPNDTQGTATALPAGEWVSGTHSSDAQDWFALALDAGDTVYLSLDLDPERDSTTWNGRVGLATFGDAGDQTVIVDDAGASEGSNPTIPSDATMITVKSAGTYYVLVDSASTGVGSATATYNLVAHVLPAVARSCRTYTVTPSGGVETIGPSTGATTIDIPVDDSMIVGHAAIAVDLTHQTIGDVDTGLETPAGDRMGLFTDLLPAATGAQTRFNTLLDQYAGIPPAFAIHAGLGIQPELNYRLTWLEGIRSLGTWRVTFRDDTNNASGGTVNQVDLVLCAAEPSVVAEPIFQAGFETGDDGFTHSGTQDEWERGTPATAGTTTANPIAPLTTCASGTGCWKTDLDSTYNNSNSQDLLSPAISLVGRSGTIKVSWWQWLQLENATFDHYEVYVQEVGGANPRLLFRWLDGTMTDSQGNPATNIGQSWGWSYREADISDYAGENIELRFHLDTDNTVVFAGAAVDDVSVFRSSYSATVGLAGSGAGFVDSSPAGIDCGTDAGAHPTCTADFAPGTPVTLTATPAAGSRFDGFSGGGCSGSASTCTVSMSAARAVTATFEAQHDLTVSLAGSGSGSVDSSPAGIDCGSDCDQAYDDGTGVTLTADPDPGSDFSGFSGAGCSGGATTCSVTIDGVKAVTATFALRPASPAYPLPADQPPADPPPAPAPAPVPSSPLLADRVPPKSSAARVTGPVSADRRITLRGTASDAFTVRLMRVSVARHVGRRCRFLEADGSFSASRDCRRTSYVDAQGTTNWSLKLPKLKPGRYTIWTRGIDAAGNVERKDRGRNLLVIQAPGTAGRSRQARGPDRAP